MYVYTCTHLQYRFTGAVTFTNITEDQYTLHAQADDHTSYSAVIIASPDEATISVFLQRIAVKYTWTVTPTDVGDTYVITLDSTFETFVSSSFQFDRECILLHKNWHTTSLSIHTFLLKVPMPVVTIEPAKVNTIPYEEEQEDTIEFTITNHGLIRADDVRLVLPDHPYLNFESVSTHKQ